MGGISTGSLLSRGIKGRLNNSALPEVRERDPEDGWGTRFHCREPGKSDCREQTFRVDTSVEHSERFVKPQRCLVVCRSTKVEILDMLQIVLSRGVRHLREMGDVGTSGLSLACQQVGRRHGQKQESKNLSEVTCA